MLIRYCAKRQNLLRKTEKQRSSISGIFHNPDLRSKIERATTSYPTNLPKTYRTALTYNSILLIPVRSVLRGHDPNRGIQHAQSDQGQRHHQGVGHRWPTALPIDVGTILPRGQRHRVGVTHVIHVHYLIQSWKAFRLARLLITNKIASSYLH